MIELNQQREISIAWKKEAENQYGLLRLQLWPDEKDYPVEGALDVYARGKYAALRENIAQPVPPARQPWEPYLSDRANGVKGSYAIARWNPKGYREVWNLWSHRWASASDDVLTLTKAESLLQAIVIPTAQPALPLTADQLFANDALMALNAKHGMLMDELMAIVRVIESIGIKETP